MLKRKVQESGSSDIWEGKGTSSPRSELRREPLDGESPRRPLEAGMCPDPSWSRGGQQAPEARHRGTGLGRCPRPGDVLGALESHLTRPGPTSVRALGLAVPPVPLSWETGRCV